MNGIAPKFGWGWEQHNALERGAAQLLAESPLKQFLNEHIVPVNYHSVRQDKECSGSHHALNLELIGQDGFGSKPPFPKLAQVLERFAPERRAERESAAMAAPLENHPDIAQKPNVYQQIQGDYQALVGLFQQIKARPPRTFWQKMQTARELEAKLGALIHYIGDMHQPMHLAEHYTWPLKESWRSVRGTPARDAHFYLETEVLYRPEELNAWQARLNPVEMRGELSQEQLSDLLARQIRSTYLGMFEMVGADQDARQAQDSPYLQALAERFKPVAEKYMTQGAQTASQILHSAYLAGGQPDLQKLSVSPPLEQAVRWISDTLARWLGTLTGQLRRLLPPGPPDTSRHPSPPYSPSPQP